MLVLLVFSGIFSGSETALVALSMARVEALVKEGRAGARALYRLKKDPSRMLTTILIGNNLVNIAASALATVMATREFGSAGPGIAVGVLTLFILVFGEITPKSLATRYSERISLFIALPVAAVHAPDLSPGLVLRPFYQLGTSPDGRQGRSNGYRVGTDRDAGIRCRGRRHRT